MMTPTDGGSLLKLKAMREEMKQTLLKFQVQHTNKLQQLKKRYPVYLKPIRHAPQKLSQQRQRQRQQQQSDSCSESKSGKFLRKDHSDPSPSVLFVPRDQDQKKLAQQKRTEQLQALQPIKVMESSSKTDNGRPKSHGRTKSKRTVFTRRFKTANWHLAWQQHNSSQFSPGDSKQQLDANGSSLLMNWVSSGLGRQRQSYVWTVRNPLRHRDA